MLETRARKGPGFEVTMTQTTLNQNKLSAFSSGKLTSRDGTEIGYRQTGAGPGLILVHGGLMASQNFRTLAACLADQFTVFVPDRRGRGLSGPFGPDYGLAREVEDLQALLQLSGAHNVFGLS